MTSAKTKRQTLNPQNQPGTSLLLSTVGPPVPLLCLCHREPGVCSGLQTPNLLVTAVKTACLPVPPQARKASARKSNGTCVVRPQRVELLKKREEHMLSAILDGDLSYVSTFLAT